MLDNKITALDLTTGKSAFNLDKDELVIIDSLLSKIIYKMNKAEIKTTFCCIGHNNTNGYITYIHEDFSKIFKSLYLEYFNPEQLIKLGYLDAVEAGVSFKGRAIGNNHEQIRDVIRWSWNRNVTIKDKKHFVKLLNKLIKKFNKYNKE